MRNVYIYIFLIFSILVSCEKDDKTSLGQTTINTKINDQELIESLPKLKDGRMVFENYESYSKYQNWIFENQNNPTKILSLNKQAGFVSLYEIYKQGQEMLNKDVANANEFIKSHPNVFKELEIENSIIQASQVPVIISYFANKDGIYQVGDSIFKISYDYYYIIENGDEAKIQSLIKANTAEIADKSIKVFSTGKNTKDTQVSYKTKYFSNSNKRIVSRLTYDYIAGFNYYICITNTQKKVLGIWIGYWLDGSWVGNQSGYYYVQGSNTMYNISPTSDGSSSSQEADYAFALSTIPINTSTSICPTYHTGKDGSESITINYTNAFSYF